MIELNAVTVAYGGVQALRSVTTAFRPGAFTCLVGPNGSGKSSLLRAVAGLCPYRGTISLDGRSLAALSRRERAAAIAYLPQSRAVPNIDARTLIAHGRFPHLGFSKHLSDRDWALVEAAAERTGTAGLLDKPLAALSGGERQRVYLAMVIAQDTETILLDEPATYLDIRHQLTLLDLLEQLRQSGKTIVMVAHDLPQAFSCAGVIQLLDHGTLVLEGPPEAVYCHPAIREVFGVALHRAGGGGLCYSLRL